MNTPKCTQCSSACVSSCSCQHRSVFLCAACITTHILSPGNHQISLYRSPIICEGNMICDECQVADTESICSCIEPIRKYCLSCRAAHINKTPYEPHLLLPIHAIKYVKSKEDVLVLFHEMNKVAKIKQALVSNLRVIDTFKDSLQGTCATFVKEIHEFEAKTVANVDAIRNMFSEKIQEICKELEEHVFERKYRSTSSAIENIKSIPEATLESTLQMFTCKVASQSCSNFMQSAISYKYVADAFEIGAFTLTLKNGKLTLFDILKSKKTVETMEFDAFANKESAMLFLDWKTVICIGGRFAFAIDVIEKTKKIYPEMNFPRFYPGVYLFNNTIYVFGGFYSNVIRSCEKMRLDSEKWEHFGRMEIGRCGFTPVKLQGNILLIGGEHARGKCEKFDIASQNFALLSFVLSDIDYRTTSLEVGNEVIVLNAGKKYRLADLANLVEIEYGYKEVHRWSHVVVRTKEFVYYFHCELEGPKTLNRMNVRTFDAEIVMEA